MVRNRMAQQTRSGECKQAAALDPAGLRGEGKEKENSSGSICLVYTFTHSHSLGDNIRSVYILFRFQKIFVPVEG